MMFDVLSLSILALSLLPMSNTLSVPRDLVSEPACRDSTTLGPSSALYVANNYISPDGYNRSATLVNGVFPAPLIKANKNDDFSLQVYNKLTDDTMYLETSIHWHGILQYKSNWADGASFITQCPIPQNGAFLYRFTTTGQTGTYWYHSHYSTQYCDGLRGPLVIYDPSDPLAHLYDVDDETTVITLSDWYHEPSPQLGEIYGAVTADSTLINGLGRYSDGPSSPLAVVNVKKGLRYRFRIIAMSCDPNFNFTIDGHRMTIIEVDGSEVEPVEVDSLPVLAGQRYSVVVTANQTVGNYWIRALPSLAGASFDGNQSMAILRYSGAPDQDPTSSPGPYELSFDEGSLHPLIDPTPPGPPGLGQADVNIQLAAGYNSDSLFTVNDVPFEYPSVPLLLQILNGVVNASQLLPSGSVYSLPPNKSIEISFPNPLNAPGGPHPIHLHGHNFYVVRVAGTTETNYVNPVRRDVVSIGTESSDNVTIRFATDNPGPWFLHCHIDWHLNHGLAVVLAEDPQDAEKEESAAVPNDWRQLCQN